MFMRLSTLHKLVIFLGFISIYLSQIWYQYAPVIKLLTLIIFLLGSYIIIILEGSKKNFKYLFGCLLFFSLLIILGGLLGIYSPAQNLPLMFFYISIVFGSLFSLHFDSYLKMIKIFVLINLLAMMYEFATISYLLEPTSDYPSFIGRAKGFISYSKEAGAFILVFTLLFIRSLNVKWFIVLLFFAILSGSRLAMLIVFLAIIIELLYRIKIKHFMSPLNIFFSLLFVIILIASVYYYSTLEQAQIIINRLSGTLDTEHSSNNERIDFWISHMAIYDGYNIIEYFIGSPGQTTSIIGNGSESALINLITDGGILALSIYIGAIIIMFFLEGFKINIFFHLSLLVIAMQLSRVNIGFLDGTLFWAYFYYLIARPSSNLIDCKLLKTQKLENKCMRAFNK